MQQNIVVRKKGSKPGHAFKKFIDKNYIASTIHGVLFPFDGFFFALHIWCGEVVAVVVVVRSSMNRHWIGWQYQHHTHTHIALISLYPTHRRQTAQSVGVAGRMFMIAFLFIHFDFSSSSHFQSQKYGEKSLCHLSWVCWRRKIDQTKNRMGQYENQLKTHAQSMHERKHIIIFTVRTHFLFGMSCSIELIYRISDAFCVGQYTVVKSRHRK